jgi:regulation of enolase protein 1 (concanavalin A-like superfamily)
MDESFTLADLPLPLRWQLAPEGWRTSDDGGLSISAGGHTDLFVDPQDAAPTLNAPRALATVPAADYQLSARVTVDFASTFDAGVLLLYAHDGAWAKLCFERSPEGENLVVSVVTRGVSDDANSFPVDGRQVWLRISRLGTSHAFHASTDGARWQFIRHFALEPAAGLSAGFLAQSPTGSGCTATFDSVRFRPEPLADLRSGV